MRTRHAVLLPVIVGQALWGQAALRGLVDGHVHYNGDKTFLEKMAMQTNAELIQYAIQNQILA